MAMKCRGTYCIDLYHVRIDRQAVGSDSWILMPCQVPQVCLDLVPSYKCRSGGKLYEVRGSLPLEDTSISLACDMLVWT